MNRQKFIDIGGIDVALNCLKQKKDLETIRASSATLLNAGLNYSMLFVYSFIVSNTYPFLIMFYLYYICLHR